jgi:hypothetical protein
MRGLIALPTVRNTAGVDLIVSSPRGGFHGNVQVKTSQRRVDFWPIGSKYNEWVGSDLYYVFLRYLPKIARFEVFLETSEKCRARRDRRD